jgi:hypothetical protein
LPATLTLSAEAEVQAAPDIAEIGAGVVTQAADAGSALAANTDPIAMLIAAARCSTLASPPDTTPPADDSGDTPNSGCLHCAGGRCHAASRHATPGAWAAFVPTDLAALLPWNVGNNGAAAWQTGHPVRGPPLWGL